MHAIRMCRGLLTGAALLVLTFPSLAMAQASGSTDRKAGMADTTDRTLIGVLTKAHNDEIAAGQKALAATQNDDVRRFAQRIVDDHTKALAKLGPIATRMGGADMASMTPADGAQAPPAARDTTLPKPAEGMGAMGDTAQMKASGDSMKADPPSSGVSIDAPPTDRQFIDAMVVNHQQLLGKLPEEGRGVMDKELRETVATTRKSVQKHFTMARDIQTKMGGREKP